MVLWYLRWNHFPELKIEYWLPSTCKSGSFYLLRCKWTMPFIKKLANIKVNEIHKSTCFFSVFKASSSSTWHKRSNQQAQQLISAWSQRSESCKSVICLVCQRTQIDFFYIFAVLAHLMSPLEPLDPLLESPLSHPLIKQRAIASELLNEVKLQTIFPYSWILNNIKNHVDSTRELQGIWRHAPCQHGTTR